MDRLDTLRAFVAVAESRGFSLAARHLGLSAPAVTRAVMQLEAQVGTTLLQRTTRTVRLTEVGERFLIDIRRALAEVDDAYAVAGGALREPQGQLAITAPSMFGRLHVLPLVIGFLADFPKVSARTFFVDRVVHLVDEGFDVAVRIAPLPDSGLTAIPVGRMRRVTVASVEYLERAGVPQRPDDLTTHVTIGIGSDAAPARPWVFDGGRQSAGTRAVAGAEPRASASPDPARPVPVVSRLWVNTAEAAVAAALSGHGIARGLYYQVADDVKAGRLKIVLEDAEPPAVPVHLVYPAGRKAAASVKAFIDFAAARLRASEVLR